MEMDKEDSDEAKVAAMGQVLAMGENVWVKVVDIKEADPGSDRGPKIGCSIKLVSLFSCFREKVCVNNSLAK
jgi:hypothetical protein